MPNSLVVTLFADLSRRIDAGRPLDRGFDEISPFRPGTVVVANVLVAEEILEDKPRMAGALADAAIGDGFLIGDDALALVEGLQVIRGFKTSVVFNRLHPGNTLSARDM